MLKRITTAFIAMCLILPPTPAFAHSILWAATNDCTCLVKDEEYAAALALMTAVPGLDDDASPRVEGTECGLEILYDEPGPPEPISVEEAVSPDLISVEEEPAPELIIVEDEMELPPEAPEEIELEETINDQIQEP